MVAAVPHTEPLPAGGHGDPCGEPGCGGPRGFLHADCPARGRSRFEGLR